MSSVAVDPDQCRMHVLTTDLSDSEFPMTLVQVEICAPDGRQLTISDGATLPSGSYEDRTWASEYDEIVAVERWQARGKLASVLGWDPADLESFTLHGEGDLPG